MFKFDDLFSLRALTFFAALAVTAHAPAAQGVPQVPGAGSTGPSQSLEPASSSPSQTVPANPSSAKPSPAQVVILAKQPTPEELGDSLAVHQRYQAAVTAYSQAPTKSAALWNKMGIAYQMLFNLKDATRCYNEALKQEPRNSRVLNNLGTVYDSEKLYKKAEHSYRKALKYDPQSALTLRNLGSNQMSQHKYKKASETYRAALAIDPKILDQRTIASVQNPTSVKDRGALHYYMAKGCVSAGNPECAIHNLRLALNEGFTSAKKIADDSSFAELRNLDAFKELIASQNNSASQNRQ